MVSSGDQTGFIHLPLAFDITPHPMAFFSDYFKRRTGFSTELPTRELQTQQMPQHLAGTEPWKTSLALPHQGQSLF